MFTDADERLESLVCSVRCHERKDLADGIIEAYGWLAGAEVKAAGVGNLGLLDRELSTICKRAYLNVPF